MNYKVISVGELLWDMLPDRKILGGAPSNLAFRLNELGMETYLVSRVGNDELGFEALEILKGLGLSTRYIQTDTANPTGTVIVEFDNHRNPNYIITPDVAYDRIELTDELIKLAAGCDCIAFGTLAQRDFKTRNTLSHLILATTNAIKFLDINLRKDCFSRESLETSLNYADILKANHHEAFELSSIFDLKTDDLADIAMRISDQFQINTILITLEHRGALLFDKTEGKHYLPGYKIELEDPLGAGDAFSAGFLNSIFHGKTLLEACEEGNKYGAIVATKKGAIQRISKDELSNLAHQNERVFDDNLNDIIDRRLTN